MDNNTIKIFFAGDFCSKPSTKYINVDENLKNLIKNSDVSIINFEVPLKPNIDLISDGYERFFQNDDTPKFLQDIGFKLFSIANNHMFDWGNEGYLKVKSFFGDCAFGAGEYEEAYKIKVVKTKGKKIGFLSLCYAARKGVFSDSYNHDGYGCAYFNDLMVNHIIVDAKKEIDYLFICCHAGIEYCDIPTPELIDKYHDFIKWGADGVIGTHPHCPQGWEMYKGKPIFYSLGNFFFNSKPVVNFKTKLPHWYEGLAVIIEISEDEKFEARVINIYNNANQDISIDVNKCREEHNKYLCNLLQDKKAYDEYFQKMINNIKPYIIKSVSVGILFGAFKSLILVNINYFKDMLLRMRSNRKQSIKSLINDDLLVGVLKRIINNK